MKSHLSGSCPSCVTPLFPGSLPVYWLPHNAWVTAVLRTAAPVPLSPNWMTAILALGKG